MPGIVQETVATHDTSGPLQIPVLIVGGGPTGLLSAYMLSKLGIKSLLIEKYPERLAAPKAHALCPRSLEICRQFGLDTNMMRKLGSPRSEARWVNFLTSLSGERIGVLPYERMDAQVLDCTPEMIHNIPQPVFEQFVAKELENDPNVEIRKNVAYVSSQQGGDLIATTVEERSTGSQYQIESRYVLACDGAKSQVRHHLQIESDGEDGYETMMTIHFEADLRPVVGERVGMLHWITDPACSGFIIAYDLGGNHVLISNFDSTKHPAKTWTQQLACETVSAAIGQDVPFHVLSYRPWLLSRKVAKKYRKGNVFLVGDAAHSFPPTGGLGLNSGIADAHNLVHKIAAEYDGWAGASILNTYEDERRQIALINSAQSVKNGKKIFSFLKSLGVAGIDDVQEARANLHKSIHDPKKQDLIATEVEGQREHFDNLGLHIGYIYGDGQKPHCASNFSPRFVPGARLPHSWIKPKTPAAVTNLLPLDLSYLAELSPHEVAERQFSTLDLVDFGSFTMISSAPKWIEKVEHVKNMLQLSGVRLNHRSINRDFKFLSDGDLNSFNVSSGLAQGGALLVRPDQHILGVLSETTEAEDVISLLKVYLGYQNTQSIY